MELENNNNLKQSLLVDDMDQALITCIQDGLPVTERPYKLIAEKLGISELEICQRISRLRENGLIKRFGIVVRHHELGYRENAMIVWNVPEDVVHVIGEKIRSFPFVTLCYRRARQLPEWPYNLFCMIHGKTRDEVLENLQTIIDTHMLDYQHEILFSKRRFKQKGASYLHAPGDNA